MNDEEILAQLRDIHLPAELGASQPFELAVWPIIGLIAVIVAILAIRLWMRNRWRRHARADLSRLAAMSDPIAQWSSLLAFAAGLSARARRPINLPNLVYRRPDSITEADRASLIDHLRTELSR